MLKILVNGFRNDCIKNPGAYFNIRKKKSGLIEPILRGLYMT